MDKLVQGAAASAGNFAAPQVRASPPGGTRSDGTGVRLSTADALGPMAAQQLFESGRTP